MLSVIDLFAGIGGLSSGLKSAGYNVLGAVEIDPKSAETYLMNHPETRVFITDIRDLSGPFLLNKLSLKRGQLDLLTGCPPCQGFSELRTRRKNISESDPRNDLVFEVLRLIRSIRPRSVIFENVPGFSADQRFKDFCNELSNIGYSVKYKILNAADFGVPQRRKRLVMLCVRGNKNIPQNWAKQTHVKAVTVKHTIAHLPTAGNSGDNLHDELKSHTPKVMERIKTIPKDGGSRRDMPDELVLSCHKKSNGYSDVYGRMAWNEVSPTITSGCNNPSKGRFLHPVEDRAITLREAALLQSFPHNYKFNLSHGKGSIAQQIGNAFPPKLIEPIASRLAKEILS